VLVKVEVKGARVGEDGVNFIRCALCEERHSDGGKSDQEQNSPDWNHGATFFRPFGAVLLELLPGAYAPGYILAPLRG